MMEKRRCLHLWIMAATVLLLMGQNSLAQADLKQDVGYTKLAVELGGAIPDGSGVTVTQVEALSSDHWMPDSTNSQFNGKTITDKSGSDTGVSSHATGVGSLFYGNTSSLSPGITDIDAYAAYTEFPSNYWVGAGYLMAGVTLNGNPIQPIYYYHSSSSLRVIASPSRVANHSWVGSSDNGNILRRLDFAAQADNFIQIVAVNNGTSQRALLSGAFNILTVGRTDGYHPSGTLAVDRIYTAGRVCPLIVAPLDKTSNTTPLVASAAAFLVQTGGDPALNLSNDPKQSSTADRSGRSILNAERAGTVKAALLAGAHRLTANASTTAQITDYRRDAGNRSANGLDSRFGAGQLDVYNSYHIIAAGEQNSAEDDPSGNGNINSRGFDVDPFFGGLSGSNTIGTYCFTAGSGARRLYASLVWHLKIDGGYWYNYDDTAVFYNLDLALYDTTAAGGERLVAESKDFLNNTENLWTAIVPGRSYRLEVTAGNGQAAFVWDYALAWRMDTPPDNDADGIEDEWEVAFGLDYSDPNDTSRDDDGDGLTALQEYLNGTAPDNYDTDGDGASDGKEVAGGGDPLDASVLPAHSVAAMTPVSLVATMLMLIFGYAVYSGKNRKH